MNPCNKYLQTSIETQSKTGIVVKLYDGAISFLNRAVLDINREDFQAKNLNINKAIEILLELNISLDLEQGGEISKNLRALYNFYIKRLRSANIKNDTASIKQVIIGISQLNLGFKQIAS